jgi:DNA-binding CsgD family transcriptional regulator
MGFVISSEDLIHVLEALEEEFLLWDEGDAQRGVHHSPALAKRLQEDPQAPLLERELEEMLAQLCPEDGRRAGRMVRLGADTPLIRELSSVEGAYFLWGRRLGQDTSGLPRRVLIAVRRTEADPLSDEALRARYRLSPREAELARQLVRGCSNAEVAEALGISPSTAQHYTERVFLKLGVRSRAEVGGKLLGG